MSQLIEKFRKALSGTAAPMGFRAARSDAPVPRMLLIGGLKGALPDTVADYIEGADAVLLRLANAPDEQALKKIAGALDGMPWGLCLEDDTGGLAGKAGDAGPDFVVFSTAERVAAVPGNKKVGKLLEVESSMDDGLLRAVADLPVDAVLLADGPDSGPLLWHQLMIFHHLSDLFPKPLIIPTPVDFSPEEVKALWEAGVDGILVAADAGKPDGFKELRRAIDALPPRKGRKGNQARVVLRQTGGGMQPATRPDEEEEEEDE